MLSRETSRPVDGGRRCHFKGKARKKSRRRVVFGSVCSSSSRGRSLFIFGFSFEPVLLFFLYIWLNKVKANSAMFDSAPFFNKMEKLYPKRWFAIFKARFIWNILRLIGGHVVLHVAASSYQQKLVFVGVLLCKVCELEALVKTFLHRWEQDRWTCSLPVWNTDSWGSEKLINPQIKLHQTHQMCLSCLSFWLVFIIAEFCNDRKVFPLCWGPSLLL